jgi:diguanylate cyclase (GGDEF)-like protein
MNLAVTQDVLDTVMPMHAIVSPAGRIRHCGPSLCKITAGQVQNGAYFCDIFDVIRPFGACSFVELYKHENTRLRVRVNVGARKDDQLTLRGSALRLPNHEGMLINLSLGISVADAVARFDLSAADFAPTDPTIDLLYLIEVNSAAFGESKRLNLRLQGAKQQAEFQAQTDALTGLRNRRALDLELDRLTANGTPFALMTVDLDYFKDVNDTYGHAAGDKVLEAVSNVLKRETRGTDYVARVGGDEFVVAFENLIDLEQLQNIARRIIRGFEMPVDVGPAECHVSASIGITLSSFYKHPSAERMLDDADSALYHSKNGGRARATVFNPGTR